MAAVTIFSDPMVDALTALTDSSYRHFTVYPCSKRGQYVPIPGIQLCLLYVCIYFVCIYIHCTVSVCVFLYLVRLPASKI